MGPRDTAASQQHRRHQGRSPPRLRQACLHRRVPPSHLGLRRPLHSHSRSAGQAVTRRAASAAHEMCKNGAHRGCRAAVAGPAGSPLSSLGPRRARAVLDPATPLSDCPNARVAGRVAAAHGGARTHALPETRFPQRRLPTAHFDRRGKAGDKLLIPTPRDLSRRWHHALPSQEPMRDCHHVHHGESRHRTRECPSTPPGRFAGARGRLCTATSRGRPEAACSPPPGRSRGSSPRRSACRAPTPLHRIGRPARWCAPARVNPSRHGLPVRAPRRRLGPREAGGCLCTPPASWRAGNPSC